MQKIVGLWGPIGSGKSTIAALLVERHGFREFSFATPLKDIARDIFDFDDAVLRGPSSLRNLADPRGIEPRYWDGVFDRALRTHLRNIDSLFDERRPHVSTTDVVGRLWLVLKSLKKLDISFTPRAALQQLGTDFGRSIWDEVWVNAAIRAVESSGAERVVLADCRFANEAAVITDRGGDVWWIDASKRIQPTEFAHASESTYEQAAPYVTRVLDNNGTLEQTAQRVSELLS